MTNFWCHTTEDDRRARFNIDGMRQSLDTALEQIAALTEHIAGLEKDADVLMGEVKALTAERDSLLAALGRSQQEVARVIQANEHWHTRVTSLKSSVADLESERDALRAKVTDLEDDLAVAQQAHANAH